MIGVLESKMSVVAEKLREIEVELSAKEGDFTLFALVELEDALGKWDIIVSADWISKNQKQILNMIAFRISTRLDKSEQLALSRIIILPPSDRFVQNLNLIGAEHGNVKIKNCSFNGIVVKEAILIASNMRQTPQRKVVKTNKQTKN